MKINKESGLPLQIYIPNLQPMQLFEMEFYTNPTAPNVVGRVQKIVMAGIAGKDAGMDYSKLEEQIVLGEFTLNGNQVRSQLPYPEPPIAV